MLLNWPCEVVGLDYSRGSSLVVVEVLLSEYIFAVTTSGLSIPGLKTGLVFMYLQIKYQLSKIKEFRALTQGGGRQRLFCR